MQSDYDLFLYSNGLYMINYFCLFNAGHPDVKESEIHMDQVVKE